MAWNPIATLTGDQGPQGSTGSTGSTGAPGADGKTVLNGSGAPSSGLGVAGDFYIDTTNNRLYGPKGASTWPGTYTSLIGPQGVQGPKGDTGDTGPQGAAGVSGPYVELDVPAGSTTPVLTHNLNTEAVMVQVREVATGLLVPVATETVDATGTRSITQCRLTFATAPTAGQYKALFVAGGGVDFGPIRTVAFGAPDRTRPPACVLYSTVDRTIPNSDVWQDTQWAVSQDTDGIWVPGTVGGGQGYMQIPVAGRYRVRFFALVGGIGLIFYAGKITMNSTSATVGAIASDVVYAENGNGEPFYLKLENNDKTYVAGDKLRFALWRGAAAGTATCYSKWFGDIFTVASLHWIGPA